MTETWKEYAISQDATHHLLDGSPAYSSRFNEVLKFHPPGLAPVIDASGAFHISPDGQPAYQSRYLRTFGFYEGRAAVHSSDGRLHILSDGAPLYIERYAWCGNFQEGLCTVRHIQGGYSHLTLDGLPAYSERYRYAGDFRDGYAVVQGEDGKHTHIDASGNLLHGRWFEDLDVFHKNHARARDKAGWHHVNQCGEPSYERRFKSVEPFYNGQARVEGLDGSLFVIDESGETILTLRQSKRSNLEALSGDMVGLWKTQTIRAAAELGVFESLPASAEEVDSDLGLPASMGLRLMRALMELGLVYRDEAGVYQPTDRGSYLTRAHPLSLADAALVWGREHYAAWSGITESLRTGRSNFQKAYGKPFFDWIQDRPDDLEAYHTALSSYARHDYQFLATTIDFSIYKTVLDAGGGKGDLMFALLRACPKFQGTVMDRPEVMAGAKAPADVVDRCQLIAGDLFAKWPIGAEAVVLARVLHDWPDYEALKILRRARQAIHEDGRLYVVEMVLDETSGDGGLLDLNMLVMTQGLERTEKQFKDLLINADFKINRVMGTGFVNSIIEASPS